MAAPKGNRYSYNNIKDTLSKDKLDQIKNLRLKKQMSMPQIAKEMNMSNCTVFRIIKQYLGLGTHRRWLENGRS